MATKSTKKGPPVTVSGSPIVSKVYNMNYKPSFLRMFFGSASL